MQEKEIRAQRFVLVNDMGEKQAELVSTNDGPALKLYDMAGDCRVRLSVEKGLPLLSVVHVLGEVRIAVTEFGPELSLLDYESRPRVALCSHVGNPAYEGPAIRLHDSAGNTRILLTAAEPTRLLQEAGVDDMPPGIAFYDREGRFLERYPSAFGGGENSSS